MTDDEDTASAAAVSSAAQNEPINQKKKRGRPKRSALYSPAMEPLVINSPSTDAPAPRAQSEPHNDNSSEPEETSGAIVAHAI